jgi:hypothetical protein
VILSAGRVAARVDSLGRIFGFIAGQTIGLKYTPGLPENFQGIWSS